VVFPPGTIAVLPFDLHTEFEGDAWDYPWRVNRGHVVSLIQDSWLPILRGLRGNEDLDTLVGSICELSLKGASNSNAERGPARLVFLDDASCVASRECLPSIGNASSRNSTGV